MKTNRRVILLTWLAATLLLAGCGGGGGGGSSGPVASTLSFPLQSGYKALVANGLSKNFTVSGTCSGTGSETQGPATTPSTFETVSGFSAVSTFSMNLTNCTPASSAQSETDYWDSNYVDLGFYTGASDANPNYGVFLTPPSIPTSVTVGGTGIIGTETLYTSNTKATGYGTQNLSYAIEADTSTTAIVKLISKVYDTGSNLLWTSQRRFRIASNGALTPLSEDVQYSYTSTNHLVFTYQ